MKRKGLKAIAQAIRDLKIQGASKVREKAVKAIAESVKHTETRDVHKFKKELKGNLLLILNARPTEPELRTAVRIILKKALHETESLHELKEHIYSACMNYEKERKKAMQLIALYGARIIPKNSIVLTHCHSSTVEEILSLAHKQKKLREVYCTETRPLFQGRITAQNLARKGIKVTLFTDSAVFSLMKKCDLFFTGADAILSDGSIINKIGTSGIALAAKKFCVPYYAATSSHAFDPLTFYGIEEKIEERNPSEVWDKKLKNLNIRNPAFDRTESEFIEGIITEKGVLTPESLVQLKYKELHLDKQKEEFLDIYKRIRKL